MTEKPKKRPLVAIVDSWGGIEDIFSYCGCEAVPCGYNVSDKEALKMVEAVDGIVFTGGSDIHPSMYGQRNNGETSPGYFSRDEGEMRIAKMAKAWGVPMFGICRGHQLLNVAYGGTLHQHVPYTVNGKVEHGCAKDHLVKFNPRTGIGHALRKHRVEGTSIHHQAVDRMGDGLVAAGWAADGLVEVIESVQEPYVLGVQFHPEMTPMARWADALWYYWIGRVKQSMRPTDRALHDRIADLPADYTYTGGSSSWHTGWDDEVYGGYTRCWVRDGDNVVPLEKKRKGAETRWWEDDDDDIMQRIEHGHHSAESTGWKELEDEGDVDLSAYACGYDRPNKAHGQKNLSLCEFPPCQYPEFCSPEEGDCFALWNALHKEDE